LQLVHDLPLQAACLSDDACKSLAELTEDLLEQLLKQSHEASTSALASAYMVASTAKHSLSVEQAAHNLDDLVRRTLDSLEPHWPRVRSLDVQTLFRSPGDASEVAARALQNVGTVQDAAAVASLLQAAYALPAGSVREQLAEASLARLKDLAAGMTDAKELGVLEASLRKGPCALDSQQEQLALRSGVRDQIFRAVLQKPPTWNSRPARGFIRHVEQCLEKARRPPEALPEAVPAPSQAALDSQSELSLPQVPSSGADGVLWHNGLEGWEVKIEIGGRQMLGGYFKPKGTSEEAVHAALEEAIQCRKALERQHY